MLLNAVEKTPKKEAYKIEKLQSKILPGWIALNEEKPCIYPNVLSAEAYNLFRANIPASSQSN